MNTFTLRQEQSLVIGETIRLLILRHDRDAVRLVIEVPAGIDIVIDKGDDVTSRRQDLVLWHPDPDRLVELIAARFPRSSDEVRRIRTGAAYFGSDPCELARLRAYTQGLCDAGSAQTGGETFCATSSAG